MKKILSIFICVLLCLSFVGCNTKKQGNDTVTSESVADNDLSMSSNLNSNEQQNSSKNQPVGTINSNTNAADTITEDDIYKIVREEIDKKDTNTLTEAQIREIVRDELNKNKVEFVPGKTLNRPQGQSFKMQGQFYQSTFDREEGNLIKKIENYTVNITSFKAKMLKKADINNADDYCLKRTYFPYLYEVEVTGKIDPKYAKETTTLDIRFPQDGALTFYDNKNTTNIIDVDKDGNFSFKTRLGYASIQDTIMITQVYSY